MRVIWILLAILTGCGASMPKGVAGPDAEALADSVMAAVDVDAWLALPAVAWTFRGDNEHIWDKRAQRAFVRWDRTEVWLDLAARRGRAREGGQWLTGDEAGEAVDEAHARWINDSFWLNPFAKIRDPGTARFIVDDPERGRGLLVHFGAGGKTPGDSYLWWLDSHDRPVAWQMWVSIVPIGGFETTWEGWTALPGGAWVATLHDSSLIVVELTDVRGASSAEALGLPDGFLILESCPAAPGCSRF